MPRAIPSLSLSRGQLLSAVCYGHAPTNVVRNRAQYLTQLGVPTSIASKATGRGNRRRYDFFDLAEVGVGLTALSYAFRPVEITKALVEQPDQFHAHCRAAWLDLDEGVLAEDWVRSRGRMVVERDREYYVRVHDRSSDGFGQLDHITPEGAAADRSLLLEPVELFPGEPARRLISLTRLLPQWVSWALDAPETKPGRKG